MDLYVIPEDETQALDEDENIPFRTSLVQFHRNEDRSDTAQSHRSNMSFLSSELSAEEYGNPAQSRESRSRSRETAENLDAVLVDDARPSFSYFRPKFSESSPPPMLKKSTGNRLLPEGSPLRKPIHLPIRSSLNSVRKQSNSPTKDFHRAGSESPGQSREGLRSLNSPLEMLMEYGKETEDVHRSFQSGKESASKLKRSYRRPKLKAINKIPEIPRSKLSVSVAEIMSKPHTRKQALAPLQAFPGPNPKMRLLG